MTSPVLRTLLVSTLSLGLMRQDAAEPFQPFQPRAYRLVNGVAFDGSDEAMIFALRRLLAPVLDSARARSK